MATTNLPANEEALCLAAVYMLLAMLENMEPDTARLAYGFQAKDLTLRCTLERDYTEKEEEHA